jgi:sodium pump decarboxylase gamma subunit
MLMDGLRLMALGMTTVFVFLTLLVLVMQASAWSIRRFGEPFPALAADPAGRGMPGRAGGGQNDRARVAAAIAAACAYRAGQGKG